jgi:hypothetical protein
MNVYASRSCPNLARWSAIHAEFVSMQQVGSHSTRLVHILNVCFCSTGETEFRSDGVSRVIRPARLSLSHGSVSEGTA